MPQQLVEVVSTLYTRYQKTTPRRLKLVDAYLGYILITGALQFVYGVVFGTFPFNAFISGFISTVASFVLAGKHFLQRMKSILFSLSSHSSKP
jgi:oligosaccharyltransferase complex subunit epsilon